MLFPVIEYIFLYYGSLNIVGKYYKLELFFLFIFITRPWFAEVFAMLQFTLVAHFGFSTCCCSWNPRANGITIAYFSLLVICQHVMDFVSCQTRVVAHRKKTSQYLQQSSQVQSQHLNHCMNSPQVNVQQERHLWIWDSPGNNPGVSTNGMWE